MSTDRLKLLMERVNLRLLLTALVVVVAGTAALLASGAGEGWKGREHWQVLVRTLGSSLIVTGGLTMIWNFVAKRAFMEEVLAKAGIAKELQFAGILQVPGAFYRDVDWVSLFRTVKKLDLFFVYAATWRHIHTEDLLRLARDRNGRIRVVLPDPDNKQVVAELAHRFHSTAEDVSGKIKEALKHFTDLQSMADRSAEIGIWLLPAAPQICFYRFDRVAVLTLYSQRPDRNPVPTFVVEAGGTLYDHVRKEFEAMIGTKDKKGIARPIQNPLKRKEAKEAKGTA